MANRIKRYDVGGQVPAGRPPSMGDLAELRTAVVRLSKDEEVRSSLERALERKASENRRRDAEARKRKDENGPTNILKELLPALARGGKVGTRPAAKPAARPVAPARRSAPSKAKATPAARPAAKPATRATGGGRKRR